MEILVHNIAKSCVINFPSKCIDHVITSSKKNFQNTVTITADISDLHIVVITAPLISSTQ